MRKTAILAATAVLALGAGTMTASATSAAIVCNAEGACWHAHRPYAYRPEYGVVVHPDDWRWAPTDHYSWREHEGR